VIFFVLGIISSTEGIGMKKIEAVIRPSKLEDVKDALGIYGIHGMTVSQVLGCGLQRGRVSVYRGHEYSINLLPKLKVEIVVKDHVVEEVVRVIMDAARTGEIGDGKVFIYPVENAVRIRTGESGNEAI
jgi:nitrogen regulatory protein P-II 1